MKNRPLLFPADIPWYRQTWPWLLIAGPAIVVVASLATAVIAIRSDDGLVAPDYYKRGLLVNQRLPKVAVTEPTPTTTVTIDAAGALTVRLEGAAVRDDALNITLTHPSTATHESVVLARGSNGDYHGLLRTTRRGTWTVTFDSLSSRLPTTIVERP